IRLRPSKRLVRRFRRTASTILQLWRRRCWDCECTDAPTKSLSRAELATRKDASGRKAARGGIMRLRALKTFLIGATSLVVLSASAGAQDFNIPGGDLKSALERYMKQSGVALMYSEDAVAGIHTQGVAGNLSSGDALLHLLKGTGFSAQRAPDGAVGIIQSRMQSSLVEPIQLAQATPARHPAVETVTVTSSKLGGADVQTIPISITALSQEQLTATQTAGGPDLIKQVPNMTFTKT